MYIYLFILTNSPTLLGSSFFHVWISSFFALPVFPYSLLQASACCSTASLFQFKVNLPYKQGCTGSCFHYFQDPSLMTLLGNLTLQQQNSDKNKRRK